MLRDLCLFVHSLSLCYIILWPKNISLKTIKYIYISNPHYEPIF